MPKFYWAGATTNLGRFGFVKYGDTLELSEHEANMVERDKDARYLRQGEGVKLPEKSAKLRKIDGDTVEPEGETEEQKAKREEEEKRAEAARQEQLKKANGEDKDLIDLQSKTKEQLLEYGKQLKDKGYACNLLPQMTKPTMLQTILQALKNPPAEKK